MGVCVSKSELEKALSEQKSSILAQLRDLDSTTKNSLVGIRRTQTEHFGKVQEEEKNHQLKWANSVECLEEEKKKFALMTLHQTEGFDSLVKKQGEEFDERVKELAAREKRLDDSRAALVELAKDVASGTFGSSKGEAEAMINNMGEIVKVYKEMKTPLEEKWRSDIFTCYEHHCAEEMVDDIENDVSHLDEEEKEALIMARIISLKNSYALNCWGGKRWDANQCAWVAGGGGDLEKIEVDVEGEKFTTVDFSLPIISSFREHYPQLVSDSAEDRTFLKFLMFFAADDSDGGDHVQVKEKQKKARRASVVS